MGNKPVEVAVTSAAWVAITAAGQSGTVFLKTKPEFGSIVIAHSDLGNPNTLEAENGFPLSNDADNPNFLLTISADNASDIYYATVTDSPQEVAKETGAVLVDVL